jgi:site-specific DNA recombinase
MLAIYLSVPEAENTRRALNTASGMRRARQMGRCPKKAPIGYVNLTATDGKKFIAQKQPEARIIAWVFHQIKKNIYRITDVWRMATDKGLFCSLSNFSKLIRNLVYCGQIPMRLSSGEYEMIPGIHEPLISIPTFYEVQDIINTKRKVSSRAEDLKHAFFLRGFLECPICSRRFTGSFSRGSKNSYPYYHCRGKCRARVSAIKVNHNYEQKLQELMLSDKAIELFDRILDDSNLHTDKAQYLDERKRLLSQLAQQQSSLSNARKLFVEDILKVDDYTEFKKEYLASSDCLKKELGDNMAKLRNIDEQHQLDCGTMMDIFKHTTSMDIADRRNLVKLFPPGSIDLQTGDVSLKLTKALSKILVHKTII